MYSLFEFYLQKTRFVGQYSILDEFSSPPKKLKDLEKFKTRSSRILLKLKYLFLKI
jgi:hypothetical protein